MNTQDREQIFTVPNFLSVIRILLIPVFILMLVQNKAFEAFLVFLLASLTDLLDGISARILRQKTKLGAFLDPIADKLLMSSGFIILSFPSLSEPYTIPIWLVIAVIGRDFFIAINALILYKWIHQTKFNPSIYGKTCAASQMLILLLVLFLNANQTFSIYLKWFYLFTLFLTILSGLHYAYIHYKKVLSYEREKLKS